MSAPETTAADPIKSATATDTTATAAVDAFDGLMTAPLYQVCLALVGVAAVITAYRLVRGPTLADRVIAIDQLGFFAVGAIALYAVLTGQPVLLSVGIVMALILFLGTAAFAMFIERRARS
ncbi:MAG: monovalent cation/H+ antiporter complex subunit F [Planctomycetota bacterium]